MEKLAMRIWVADIESALDKKLTKWKKESKIENGEAIQLSWQFEQTHFILDIFWENHKETAQLQYLGPRVSQRFNWHGLNDRTYNKIIDRVGNLAQITMHPPVDSTDG